MSTTRRIYIALFLFASVNVLGTVGYIILEDARPLNALYMTVITVMTVGYEEAVILDDAGRIFTIFLIMAGLGTWSFLVITVVTFFVEGEFREFFKQRNMEKRIRKMKDHFIICGLGQAGRSVLSEIMAAKVPCMVVEKDQRVVDEMLEHYPDLVAIVGDATKDESLEAAGVDRARGLIAATESDSDNLLVTLTARSKNKALIITSRATRSENYDKMRIAGANHVVMPNVIGGMRMAATLLRPQVVDFLEVMMRGSGETLRLEQANVPDGSSVIGKTLAELAIPNKTGLLVVAIKRKSGESVFSPTSKEVIKEGDIILVMGHPEEIPTLESLLAGSEQGRGLQ